MLGSLVLNGSAAITVAFAQLSFAGTCACACCCTPMAASNRQEPKLRTRLRISGPLFTNANARRDDTSWARRRGKADRGAEATVATESRSPSCRWQESAHTPACIQGDIKH